jgi:NosR/NirI family nitrous oxide reductase transcriptional regulator
MSKRERSKKIERWLAITAIASIVVAWFVGASLQTDNIMPAVEAAMPAAGYFENIGDDTFAAYADQTTEMLLGYVTIGEAVGYGGPLLVAVGLDLEGNVVETAVASHVETPSFFKRVMDAEFPAQLIGKSYSDPFRLETDLDGVTGATYTARGLANAVLDGSQQIADQQLAIGRRNAVAAGYCFWHSGSHRSRPLCRWVILPTSASLNIKNRRVGRC